MGLLYTKFYMDFDEEEWNQISVDPIVFQTIKDNVSLEIEDTSHKSYKLNFKEGGKLNMFRVVGKFRLTWDDEDVTRIRVLFKVTSASAIIGSTIFLRSSRVAE